MFLRNSISDGAQARKRIFFSLEIDLEIARLYLSLFCPQKNG